LFIAVDTFPYFSVIFAKSPKRVKPPPKLKRLKQAALLASNCDMTILAKATAKFAETTIDDEVVLMNIDSGSFHALKGTGLAIWKLIDGERSTDAIMQELVARYTVKPEQCAAEVATFTAQLTKAGFIVAH
jgi:pyrroloquinoline quinone biosynthesis protein D